MAGRRALSLALAALGAGLAAPAPARAHGFDPVLLELRERARPAGRYDVTWKVPLGAEAGEGASPDALAPRLPARCADATPASVLAVPGARLRVWSVDCGASSLAGSVLAVDGLTGGTDVLVRVVGRDGDVATTVLRHGAAAFAVRGGAARPLGVVRAYVALGVEHVLTGYDHLLFVLALLLLVRTLRGVAKTVTAFTLGHSVTLALATLGVVFVPQAPVEAAIALSIALLAAELLRAPDAPPTLARSRPWWIAAAFGTLHGFGFAGALRELGLPRGEIPLALLAFNVGVELGQLAFVLAAFVAIGALVRLPVRWPRGARAVVPYAMGSIAAAWCMMRIAAFWSA